ncbi:MAG: hypothetical protein IKR61_04720, partial [Lachnospiraceae bacterium]|nr:hypothetical protein [Lachnospiraceae bacterium]
MTRLIDADALKRKFKAERGGLWAMSVVDSMQTVDAVEAVVRCEDCKYWGKNVPGKFDVGGTPWEYCCIV